MEWTAIKDWEPDPTAEVKILTRRDLILELKEALLAYACDLHTALSEHASLGDGATALLAYEAHAGKVEYLQERMVMSLKGDAAAAKTAINELT